MLVVGRITGYGANMIQPWGYLTSQVQKGNVSWLQTGKHAWQHTALSLYWSLHLL